MTHTQGPWEVWADFNVKAASGFVATCGSQRVSADCGTAENRANAVLIASAPEMLAALLEVERHHVEQNKLKGRNEKRSHTLRTVRAAIAKAKGITP